VQDVQIADKDIGNASTPRFSPKAQSAASIARDGSLHHSVPTHKPARAHARTGLICGAVGWERCYINTLFITNNAHPCARLVFKVF
jgi:hypothetical protein